MRTPPSMLHSTRSPTLKRNLAIAFASFSGVARHSAKEARSAAASRFLPMKTSLLLCGSSLRHGEGEGEGRVRVGVSVAARLLPAARWLPATVPATVPATLPATVPATVPATEGGRPRRGGDGVSDGARVLDRAWDFGCGSLPWVCAAAYGSQSSNRLHGITVYRLHGLTDPSPRTRH